MIRVFLVALGLIVMTTGVDAQTQSLKPTPGACTAGSQSVRVCSNDFQSCNDVCTARALDASSEIAGCATSCCYSFNVCLRMRGCGERVFNCN